MGCSMPKLALSIAEENLINMLVLAETKANPDAPRGRLHMETTSLLESIRIGMVGVGPNGKCYFLGHEVVEYERVPKTPPQPLDNPE